MKSTGSADEMRCNEDDTEM